MSERKNFYIFTGKGGVGKTTLAVSFAKHLKDSGEDVLYISLENTSLKEDATPGKTPELSLARELGIPCEKYLLEQCACEYISKKIKSDTAARWIVRTPFFRALVNMIPGFNYLIYMGKVLETIQSSNNKKVIVLDSPSSGHALTMLESAKNFNELFKSGVIFEDTKKMLDMILGKDFTKIVVIALPTMMAVNEARDLEASIQDIFPIDTQVVMNNTFFNIDGLDIDSLPKFMKQKVTNEKEVFNHFFNKESEVVKHVLDTEPLAIIEQLTSFMGILK